MDSVAPIKKVRAKANSKPWFDSNNLCITKNEQAIFKTQKVRRRNRLRKI